MKGKVTVNINQSDYVFIDGATGQEYTKEEFARKYSRSPLGGLGVDVRGVTPQETGEANKQE